MLSLASLTRARWPLVVLERQRVFFSAQKKVFLCVCARVREADKVVHAACYCNVRARVCERFYANLT